MHRIVEDEMEAYLTGEASPAFHAHLDVCSPCRTELAEFESVSQFVRDLGVSNLGDSIAPEPSLGFYNRVSARIVEDDRRKIGWGFFSPGPAFFRKVAFASLLLMGTLGALLVSRENVAGGTDAVAIMAQHDASGDHPESADRDRLLLTLSSYRP